MRLLIAIILLLPAYLHAQTSNEVLGGAITYHLFNIDNVSSNYSNKLNSTGQLIDNPMIGFRHVEIEGVGYMAKTVFTGANSIGKPMVGGAYSVGLANDGYRVGLIGGLYMQNNSDMLARGVVPPMFIPMPGWGPSVILGFELVKTFNITEHTYFILNGLISPILLNATVGIGYNAF